MDEFSAHRFRKGDIVRLRRPEYSRRDRHWRFRVTSISPTRPDWANLERVDEFGTLAEDTEKEIHAVLQGAAFSELILVEEGTP
jgi:hypothetical protein